MLRDVLLRVRRAMLAGDDVALLEILLNERLELRELTWAAVVFTSLFAVRLEKFDGRVPLQTRKINRMTAVRKHALRRGA